MAEKGAKKTLWQLIKYLSVSCVVSVIQLSLAYLLPYVFDGVTATLPGFLAGIFNPDLIFDVSTDAGKASMAKYVVGEW